MKSIDFIKNRSLTWFALNDAIQNIGGLAEKNNREQELVSFMQNYRRTCADLSLARSLFPGDQLIHELNTLVIRAMAFIGGCRQNDGGRIVGFYTQRVPQLVMTLSRHFLIVTVLFLSAACFGYFLTMLNPFTANAVVGDEYIYMTINNIEKGAPFAVYESGLKYFMSSFIMANNIKVAFTAFAFGALYGIGTFYILVFNGLMLGCITAVFAQYGLLVDFSATVLVHGTLELFAILVAGAAGLRFGQSIFRPGNLTRLEAIYIFGNEAFQLCAAMVPVFVIAGILEGYVTPLHLSLGLRAGIIVLSAVLLFLYLGLPTLLYTRRLARRAVPVNEPVVKIVY